MAECKFCKADTELYDSGVPVCVNCADAREAQRKPPSGDRVLHVLHEDFQAATDRARAAIQAFDAVTREARSGLPQPDGTQRIHNVSREVSQARIDLMRAHNRLSDYMSRSIVPDDLKRSG